MYLVSSEYRTTRVLVSFWDNFAHNHGGMRDIHPKTMSMPKKFPCFVDFFVSQSDYFGVSVNILTCTKSSAKRLVYFDTNRNRGNKLFRVCTDAAALMSAAEKTISDHGLVIAGRQRNHYNKLKLKVDGHFINYPVLLLSQKYNFDHEPAVVLFVVDIRQAKTLIYPKAKAGVENLWGTIGPGHS